LPEYAVSSAGVEKREGSLTPGKKFSFRTLKKKGGLSPGRKKRGIQLARERRCSIGEKGIRFGSREEKGKKSPFPWPKRIFLLLEKQVLRKKKKRPLLCGRRRRGETYFLPRKTIMNLVGNCPTLNKGKKKVPFLERGTYRSSPSVRRATFWGKRETVFGDTF